MTKIKSQYKNLKEWKENDSSAHYAAYKMNKIKEISEMFGWLKKRWTKEKCIEDAKKYKSRSEWNKKSAGAYSAANRNKWISECVTHMERKHRPNNYWTKEKCIEDAKKYKSRSEWKKKSPSAVMISRNNGWIEHCIKHMVELMKPANYWTKEKCYKEALKFKTVKDWSKSSSKSYDAAKRNKWTEVCRSHMVELMKPVGYWTKEKCVEDAKNYKIKTEWQINSAGAYSAACKNGWLNECFSHTIELIKPDGYWTKERCIEETKQYNSKSEWRKFSSKSYHAAHRNKWVFECSKHMKK